MAQSVSDTEIRNATEALSAKYQLNADQSKQMYQVQVMKSRNMAAIAQFQANDTALYLNKLENVQKITWTSIRRILQNKEQVKVYQQTQSDVRTQRQAKRKELLTQKAAKQVIDAAVLAIYAE